jgi:vitamin B12 transporter
MGMKNFFFILIIFISSNLILFSDETGDFNENDIPVFEGDELVVKGNYNSSIQKTESISKEEIEKYNPQSLPELLQNAFNLSLTQNGGYGTQSSFSIRGSSSSEVLVLINGVPVNSSQSGNVDLSTIPLNSIKKIEVTYGGSDTKYNYSGAMGGIINIITEGKEDSNIYTSLDISNLFYYPEYYYTGTGTTNRNSPALKDFFDTQKILFNFGIGGNSFFWDFSEGANIAKNKFVYKDTNNISRRMDHNEVWDLNFKNSFTINLPYYMKIILSNSYYHGDKNIHGSMYNTNYGSQVENLSLSSLDFNALMVGSDKIDTHLILSHKYHNLNWKDLSSSDVHNLNTITVINKWDFLPINWLVIQPGGDFTYDYMDSTSIGQKNLFNGGGYVTGEFSILKTAKIIASVKVNYDKNFTSVIPVIPKLGAVFFLGKYFTLKSNFYRSFRNPTFNDLYWPKASGVEGNPDLKPETGIGGDLILSFAKKGILSAESTVYINYLQDAIKWAQESDGIWRPSNIGKSFYFGSENKIKSDFSKYFEINTSYNFLLSYLLSYGYTFESDKRVPYTPLHTFGFGVTVNWNPGKEYSGNINFTGHYESDRFTDTLNIGTISQFFTFDVSFNQNFYKIFTFYTVIKNAFNNHYFLVDGYPMPAGSVTIGIKINYKTNFDDKEGKKK